MHRSNREDLRKRAEDLVRSSSLSHAPPPAENVGQLVHELSVYEEELEIQNEELRGAQTDLLASQRRFAQLFEEAPNAYFVLDDDAVITDLNARAEALVGQPRAWAIGKPLLAFLAPESHAPFALYRRDVVLMEAHARLEVTLAAPRSAGRPVLLDAVRVQGEQRLGPRLLVAAIDVSDLRLAEAQRRRADARYRNEFERSRDARLVANERGELIDANPAACLLLGRSREALLGAPLPSLGAEGHEAAIAQTLATHYDPQLHVLAFERGDGAPVWVEVSVSPLDEDVGGHVLLVARDLTERRAAEEERTRLEGEMRKAQRLEALGRLAGGIAHDMNNVLAAVLAVGSLLLEDAKDETQRADLSTLVAAARRGADLTRRLLAFARGEQSTRAPVSVSPICREVLQLVRRTADRRVTIELEADDDAQLVVDGDAGALSQVMLNLCVNSLDAMPDGGRLTIGARARGGEVVITVADTGAGMDHETASHAFDPFFTTKPAGKGTGLGLAMVYGTVKKHGGRVALESVTGAGTTVIVTLPGTQRRIPAPTAGGARSAALHGRCLLVDDDAIVLHASSALLRHMGLEVTSVDGGRSALARIDAGERFALFVIDVNMPEIDGIALTFRILERDPQARVLLCSGYSPEAIPQDLLDRPRIRFASKPFGLAELSATVGALLEEP